MEHCLSTISSWSSFGCMLISVDLGLNHDVTGVVELHLVGARCVS